jgi:hypothetical protein
LVKRWCIWELEKESGKVLLYMGIIIFGQKFFTNMFVGNFIQPTYKSDMYYLNM